ncbi:leucyl-tRNA synthetase [Annulohypoxylon maeteangense]|uniref:leucyl-tRNA synthetase n=1 Tax=Annulohypoxylon maeteangense TaxID=1927788 RepID=UPI0020077323|nr:leucyl-tRNA synthetase [Annulohypoxylon maeteangense]KAI0883170.1 leucyl-tRNA synthetase [Annulohypoxylon maeteangense]
MHSVARKIAGQSRPQLRFVSLWSASPQASLLRRSYATTKLDLPALDRKWRRPIPKRGESSKPVEDLRHESSNDRMYILSMFPYPSGNLHLGHLRVYTIADVIARFRRLQGHDVLLPMGWDAFGLPAENAAIERGIDPAVWTRDNIARMKEQLECMNGSFDWSREFATCDPEFYKHTQKIFLLLHKHGLVSQKKATVNWDPVDMTVLANEQVDADGRSWRSGAKIVQRELEQWFFHITKFQESLLEDLNKLSVDEAWPERVLTMQKNWLGRTEAAYYDFACSKNDETDKNWLKIYTTRPETIYAAQFIALSPQSPIVQQMAQDDSKLQEFLERVKDLPPDTTEGYQISQLKATSPLTLSTQAPEQNISPLPVFVAPYVRGDYETGAIMGVPAHDARDFAFWQRHCPEIPLKYAVSPEPDGSTESLKNGPYLESGYCTPLTGSYSTMLSSDAAKQIIHQIKNASNFAQSSTKWRIRDWLISRQRYWGTPIPIVHCSTCGPQPVPDDQLPVTLPKVDAHWEDGRAGNPLETATDWVNTSCPKCHGPAKRDTDTMDTFVDSSWYYMRFPDPHNSEAPISKTLAKSYLPVDVYIGGVEHAILHLLYARFIYKAVVDLLGLPVDPSKEPFKRLITQGMVHGKTYSDPDSGRFLKPDEVDLSDLSKPKVTASGKTATVSFEKMSKSKHNGVDPTTFIAKYGSDATRAHILFQAPVGEVLNWDEDKILGVIRWLRRVFEFIQKVPKATDIQNATTFNGETYFQKEVKAGSQKTDDKNVVSQRAADAEVWRATQNTIISVTNAIEKVYSMNTTVSSLMELTNVIIKNQDSTSDVIKREAALLLIRMMAPITPAIAEECWSILQPGGGSVFADSWPAPDNSLRHLGPSRINCAVQVNGKLRCVVEIPMKPAGMADGSEEFLDWVRGEILKSEEARGKLVGENDIMMARKVFSVKGGAVMNYVVPKVKGR